MFERLKAKTSRILDLTFVYRYKYVFVFTRLAICPFFGFDSFGLRVNVALGERVMWFRRMKLRIFFLTIEFRFIALELLPIPKQRFYYSSLWIIFPLDVFSSNLIKCFTINIFILGRYHTFTVFSRIAISNCIFISLTCLFNILLVCIIQSSCFYICAHNVLNMGRLCLKTIVFYKGENIRVKIFSPYFYFKNI